MKHHLFLHGFAAAMLALCAACTADLGDTLADPQPIVFSAVQLEGETTFTRAATNGTWDGGEQVAIKINGVVKKYIVDKFGALTPDGSTTPFNRTSTSDIAFTAWYPYSDEEPTQPTIVTDQSTTEAQESCNLMTASGKAVNGKTATVIQFSHQTARLRFYLTDSDSNNAPVTGATVKVTIGGQNYTAHEDGEGYYSILVAPETTVSYGQDFLTITASGKTYKATAPERKTFYTGTSYNYTFALKCPPYLTFTANAEQGFKMTQSNFSYGTFEYSVNNGEWKTVTSGAEVTFGGNNGTLRLRGISSRGTGASQSAAQSTISFTNDNVPVAASGDIRTLVDYRQYDTVNTGSACFRSLFKGCTMLTSAPELPATALATNCYYYMFSGCTKLKTAPELPATTLAASCYNNMFQGCTALEKAPELPATTLVASCYTKMFWKCTNLKEVTIKAEKAAEGVDISKALDWWLASVASNGTIHCTEAFYTTLKDLNNATILPKGWTRGDLTN